MRSSPRSSPTTVAIDLKALRRNFEVLRSRFPGPVKTLCTVKSNAYGHCAVPVARTLQAAGADWFGVGTIDEGVELRKGGIGRPILILLGPLDGPGGFPRLVRFRLTPVLYDLETAGRLHRYLARVRRSLDVHIKVDTGMTRLGVLAKEAGRFFGRLGRLPRLRPTGLLSHLADADDDRFTRRQFSVFQGVAGVFLKRFPGGLLHLDNSLAAIDRRTVGGGAEMVRLGIALYGAAPVPRQRRAVDLRPVLSWRSRIVSVKRVPKGTFVSYGRTFRTARASTIGVVPVGYADGYPRTLSNRAQVLVRGRRVPVLGTVCMDMMMVDLTSVRGSRVGDPVVLIGREGREEIRAEELAQRAGTISYEVFCRISGRNRRVFRDA